MEVLGRYVSLEKDGRGFPFFRIVFVAKVDGIKNQFESLFKECEGPSLISR